MFCCTLLYVHSSIAIILMGKRELIALLILSSWCLVMVERLFLAVPRGCLQFVIVVFPDHIHLLFLKLNKIHMAYKIRYLAIYMGSLKVCNVRYILSYKHENMELYTRNALKYSFLLLCIDRMLNNGLKSQPMVLHNKLQSEMVLTIFTIFVG